MKKALLFLSVFILCITFAACGNNVKAPFSAIDCVGQNYETTVAAFKKSGFTKIETTMIEDLTSSSPIHDGDIEQVLIGGTTDFFAKDRFQKDTPVLITYHAISKLPVPISASKVQGHDYMEIVEMFKAAGFINVSDSEVYDIDPDDFDGEYENEVSISGSSIFLENDSIPFDAEISIVCHRPYEKYIVKIHVDFISNIIFNKYDVVLSIDGEDKLTLEHGEDTDQEFKLREGEHVIAFSEKGTRSVKGETSLFVDCDIDAAYKIYCYTDNVSIDTDFVDLKKEIAEDEAKIGASASEYVCDNYETVLAELTALGFTNIKTKVLYDIVLGWTKEGEVKNVSIDGRTDFKRSEIFKKDAEVIITYHMKEEDDPLNIKMEFSSSDCFGMDYLSLNQTMQELGFTNIVLEQIETSNTNRINGEVSYIKIDYESFEKGDIFSPGDKVVIKYYTVNPPVVTDSPSVDYSTNDLQTAKKGNSGVFAYKSSGGVYDNYYIIDFDEGYVYWFSDGNDDNNCDRLIIDSGNLNDVLIITYHDGSDVWSYGLHFKWKNHPDHLVLEDNDHFEYDFYTTNLANALALKSSKLITDY